MTRIGVISDTHGMLRPEATAALQGSDLILHAGDVGSGAVLEQLAAIARVVAVRGNNDFGPWANQLREWEVVEVGPLLLYVLHDRQTLEIDPAAAGVHAVISGHSHRPDLERKGGVLYLNPGSAGPRRFTLPVSVARLVVGETGLEGEIVELCSLAAGAP